MEDYVQRPDLARLRPEQARYIEALEKFAASRTTSIVTNGRFPKWSIDRWISVASVIVILLLWVFGIGGRWNEVTTMQRQLAQHLAESSGTFARQDVLTVQLQSISVRLRDMNEKLDRLDR